MKLSNTQLFRGIEEPKIESLLGCFETKEIAFKKGEYVLKEGNPTEYIGVVLSGAVIIELSDVWGNNSVINRIGVGGTFAEAFAKAQLGSNSTMKKQGRALLSVREGDKERVVDLAAKLLKFGFELDATHGTAIVLGEAGINPRLVNKVHEGRPHIQDRIKNGEYTYIINTTAGRQAIEDSKLIRRSALQYKVHYDTTLNGGFATAMALNADATEKVISVQEMHAQIKK